MIFLPSTPKAIRRFFATGGMPPSLSLELELELAETFGVDDTEDANTVEEVKTTEETEARDVRDADCVTVTTKGDCDEVSVDVSAGDNDTAFVKEIASDDGCSSPFPFCV